MENKVNKKLLKASAVCLVIFIVCLAFCGIAELCVLKTGDSLSYLSAGERWSADGSPYSVCAVYLEEDSALIEDEVLSWANSIDNGLLEASISASENGRSWAYCYGNEFTVSVEGPVNSSNLTCIAAGGDFFILHPLNFSYGSGFLTDTSNPTGAVLDTDAAWKLFGSINVVGMEFTIDDVVFTVSGVTEHEKDDKPYETTYGESARVYLSWAGYKKLYGDVQAVTMFEAVLPNPVKGFAKNIFDNAVSVNDDTSYKIDANARYSLANRFANMKTLSYSWTRTNSIEMPYWENEARVHDYKTAVLVIFEIGFAAVGVVALLLTIILFRISGFSVIGKIVKAASNGIEKRKNNQK